MTVEEKFMRNWQQSDMRILGRFLKEIEGKYVIGNYFGRNLSEIWIWGFEVEENLGFATKFGF